MVHHRMDLMQLLYHHNRSVVEVVGLMEWVVVVMVVHLRLTFFVSFSDYLELVACVVLVPTVT